jgi:hypothetical protein
MGSIGPINGLARFYLIFILLTESVDQNASVNLFLPALVNLLCSSDNYL